MLKSKIQWAVVSRADVQDEEFLGLERELLKQADLWPLERVEVYNHDNGARFSAFVQEIKHPAGRPDAIQVGGAAAHLVRPGHRLTICSYIIMSEPELASYRPKTITLK